MAVVEVKDQEQFTSLTTTEATNKLVSIYFYTSWAEPCKPLTELYNALSEDPSNSTEKITFISINADDHSDIAELFDTSSVPYFVFIYNGTILKELSTVDPKEVVSVLDETKKLINNTSTENVTTDPSTDSKVSKNEDENTETEEEINARLVKLTNAAPVMLFMKGSPSEPKCGFSRQIVGILREHQVRFGFFDILRDDTVRQHLKTFSDWPTFPQLYINGEFQGGLDIIKENLEDDADYFQHTIQQ